MSVPQPMPLPPVRPCVIALPDGAELEMLADVPESAADRRRAVQSATLYCPAGLLLDTGFLSAYVGLSSALHTARAATSYTNWVVAQRKITSVAGMALLRRDRPYPADQLRYIESRVMQLLSSDLGMIALTNRQTSAQMAAARLTRAQVLEGQDVADAVAQHIWTHLFARRTNPWFAPAANTREKAVRIVRRAAAIERRAVDVHDIVRTLGQIGHVSSARQLDYSVRRDLEQREPSRGRPRVIGISHRHRRLFYAPSISRREALAGYDLAKPKR